MWLTLLALRNSIAVLMASLAVALLGFVAVGRLPIDLFPNINLPIINIGTVYTGAGVLDVEKTVTYPIEKAVSAVSDVKHVESKSRQGLSTVRVWMNWGADVANGQTEVIQRIQQILNTLPAGIKQPFILRFDLSNIPVALLTVSGGSLDEKQLYDLAYNTIEPQIERLGGVASASVDGGKVRQITVNLNRDQLYAKGLSVLDVVRAVNDSNFLLPSGDIRVGRLDYNIYTNNQFKIVQPMQDIVVRKSGPNGVPIHVKDIGSVEDSAEKQTAIVRVNGDRAVFLRVNKQPGANTVAVVDQVKALMPNLIGVPSGVNLAITFDQSTYIRQAIQSLWHEALQGSFLAFLVILIFLRSLTSTLIISIAIPLSILLSFICLYFLDQTLNVFTLGGLALAVGRLVDDSIVELENINRHLNIPARRAGRGARGGDAHLLGHHHHHHRLPAHGVSGGADQAALHPADIHHLGLAVRLVPGLADRHAAAGPARAPARGADRPRIAPLPRPRLPGVPPLLRGHRRALPATDRVGARASPTRGRLHRPDVRGEPVAGRGARVRAPAADRHRVLPAVRRGAVPHRSEGADRHPGRGDRADGARHGGDRSGDSQAGGAHLGGVGHRHPAGTGRRLHEQQRAPQRRDPGLSHAGRQANAQ
jgi:hypothetical protein